jgi:glucose/mannose transport system substrate-binding protein
MAGAGAFDVLMVAIAGKDVFQKVFGDKDAEAAAGP